MARLISNAICRIIGEGTRDEEDRRAKERFHGQVMPHSASFLSGFPYPQDSLRQASDRTFSACRGTNRYATDTAEHELAASVMVPNRPFSRRIESSIV
jgi:hypothetical protein